MRHIDNTHWYRVIDVTDRQVLLNWEQDYMGTWRIDVTIPPEDDDLLNALTELYRNGERLFIVENQSDMDDNGTQLEELRKAIAAAGRGGG